MEYENLRLEQTIALAKEQLQQAKLQKEKDESSILSMKKDMHENTAHSLSGLWSPQNFEDLVEMSQYATQISDKIDDYEALENNIARLTRTIDSPYFARIDFQFDGEEGVEPIYIGRSSLAKGNAYEMVVYDWRSPIASIFYRFGVGRAFYEAPKATITGEVSLKRQYEIKKGMLEYYFDADVAIMDEFLRKMLSQNTSPKMKTIIETIQKEQDLVIRDLENDLMMVQGVAGSGKTSIALHRTAYLMYQGLQANRLSANNILILSPNTLFEGYISNVLPELGEKDVTSMVLEDIIRKVLRKKRIQTKHQFLECLIANPHSKNRMKESIEFKTSHRWMEVLDRFLDDLPRKWIEFRDVYFEGECIVRKEALRDKLLSRNPEIPLVDRLEQLEEFILESALERGKKRIGKSAKEELKRVLELDVEELYRQLFSNEDYFYRIAENVALPDCIEDVILFTRESLSADVLRYDDAASIAYLSIRIHGTNEYKHIKQVVIDEAQDYYPLHYELFHQLFPNAKFTVLGDINQTLEKKEDLSLYEGIQSILNKKTSLLVTMDKSFRCTNEILRYSSRFLESDGRIESFNRSGEEPHAYATDSRASWRDAIVAEVGTCLERGYQSIGLICKTERNATSLFDSLKDRIELSLVKNNAASDLNGTFVMPVYMSKGLEFDAVLICDADRGNYHSEDDKKMLYIACTRALHRLNLFGKGELSPWCL